MKRTSVVVAICLALMLAACGGGGGGAKNAAPAERIGVKLEEFTIVIGKASVPGGRVRFITANAGTVPHMLVVIRTDLAPDKLPVKGDVVDKTAAGLTIVGEIPPIDPGKNARKVFDVSQGKYVLICNVATHYGQGMRIALTVTAPSPSPTST